MDMRVAVTSVLQQAVEKLRAAILAGVFAPGDRLVEADLCARLGVSRPSVREALRSLEAEGLVSIIPNKGPQIPVLSWEQAAEIYRVRALLEGEAAALCASRAGPDAVARMRGALDLFAKAVRSGDSALRLSATADFYSALQQTAGNTLIDDLLRRLMARINFLRAQSMSRRDRAKSSLQEMRAIFEAIVKGDADAARRAAERHVENASLAARQAIENAGATIQCQPQRGTKSAHRARR
ncbi:GntR family transcriptional regulator [Pseudolabrys taiwanensis]|uniref:GntR family transcriptional regulator n=1 Tax=Pseudolabrys taiwanensis TaxID=331696 RepID=A0A345ZUV9_9HYPH|nr:GntR family transcriptional regulator [Pseudolabrys taiwanensis]AXK80706.1 GntR family transcriptional regulator [Pseudolabrys taiwanensis]